MTTGEYIAFGTNILCSVLMLLQHIRHRNYRERIHALLGDEGYVQGEAQLFIDENLRLTAQLEMPEPTARDFAHALLGQEHFKRAVAHELLHDIYVQTYGRKQ